ncbi:hypothetical protein N836_29970 [Leptolyngbya sp. Heron Island J]|uniref:O-antigen ligase family protein n=1 Tax=Leptolyngbya sp. Heron Island J TaxID=1385935 RepID=UPI0003B9D6AA|nr:O-antigen ligase family protein [Leptolyngbya sp. Heron Island J]ESA38756.1 hypothetical protein N836_29970 [Leptolyngbya sp. Heron Island J]
MIDTIAGLVIVLNSTYFFIFASPLIGIPVALATQALLAANFLYIYLQKKQLLILLRKKIVIGWVITLGVWPLLTSLYSASASPRNIGLALYFCSLFLLALIYTTVNGWRKFHALILWSVVLSAIGLILSLIFPETFTAAGLASGARSYYRGRAFGFFMQPNRAAANIAFLCIIWLSGSQFSNIFKVFTKVLLWMLLILVTASRGGLVTSIAAILLIFLDFSLYKWNGKKYLYVIGKTKKKISEWQRKSFLNFKKNIFIYLLFLACSVLVFQHLSPNLFGDIEIREFESVISRTTDFFALDSLDEVQSIDSAQVRLRAQKQFIHRIYEHPLIGRGLGSSVHDVEKGVLFLSSHNAYLSALYDYGVLYLIVYIYTCIYLYRTSQKSKLQYYLGNRIILQFLLCAAVTSFFNNQVHDSRAYFAILGGLTSLALNPEILYVKSNQRHG